MRFLRWGSPLFIPIGILLVVGDFVYLLSMPHKESGFVHMILLLTLSGLVLALADLLELEKDLKDVKVDSLPDQIRDLQEELTLMKRKMEVIEPHFPEMMMVDFTEEEVKEDP